MACAAIREMRVRGAPLIGAATAHGMALAVHMDPLITLLQRPATLYATRPTAVNLSWALDEMDTFLAPLLLSERKEAAHNRAAQICNEDVGTCSAIGDNGSPLSRSLDRQRQAIIGRWWRQRPDPLQCRLVGGGGLGHGTGTDI